MKSSAIRVPMVMASLLALASPALADSWQVDPSHSDVGFSVPHMMISRVKGEFKEFSGKAEIDDKNLTRSQVTFEVKVASVDTDEAKRDEHLRGGDFFDAEKYPLMVFKSTKVRRAGKGYKVTGDLTLHGVTKPVTLAVTLTKPIQTPFGTTARGVSATGVIKRKDFGMTWNNTLDAGGLMVGEEVEIQVELELVKQ